MSVVVTARFSGDPEKLQLAMTSQRLLRVLEHARKHDVIYHRLVVGEGEFMMIDEWPGAGAFEAFCSQQQEITQILREAGISARPEVRIWDPMDIPGELVPHQRPARH